jgi:hypothetical protein
MTMRLHISRVLMLAIAALIAPRVAHTQERLVGTSVGTTGVFFDNWSLPTAIATTTLSGGTAMVTGASQLTLPVAVVVPVADGWTIDAYGSYVRSEVRLATPDANGRTKYRLDGPTDARVRVVGQLLGESLLFTAGVSAPTGRTKLDPTELTALSVIAAPGLRFRSAYLGAGAAATVGLILSRPVMGWGVALGTSYEARGTYAPVEALGAGQTSTNLRPGNAGHVSLALERLIGGTRHLLNFGGDVYQAGELSSTASTTSSLALGPTLSGSYEVDAVFNNWESLAFVVGRHRAEYRLGGESLKGSDRTELEGGVQTFHALSSSLGLRLGVDGRVHSTGVIGNNPSSASSSTPDVGFATAGVKAGGGTVALRIGNSGAAIAVEPFVRAQLGTLDFSTTTRTITGFSGGATLTARF